MAEFYIYLEGTWHFDYLIESNSKEEAIEQAVKDIDEGSVQVDIFHENQWFDGDEEHLKRLKELRK